MDLNEKETIEEPELLKTVLEAISCMRGKNGSSQKQIIKHIADILNSNISLQVRRALDHGLSNGLIKSRRGKYVIILDTEKTKRRRRDQRDDKSRRRSRSRSQRRTSDASLVDGSYSGLDQSLSEDRGRRRSLRSRSRKDRIRAQHGSTASQTNEDMTPPSQSHLEEKLELPPTAGYSSTQIQNIQQDSNPVQENKGDSLGDAECNQAPSDDSPKDVSEKK